YRSHGEIGYFSRSSNRQKINDLAFVQGRLLTTWDALETRPELVGEPLEIVRRIALVHGSFSGRGVGDRQPQ
ncbi:hypothetical protein, partial [Sinorhizobium meliloti]|uniref:hypothetical protein n=1 Tax=Rhizobium meliloti TaxID=382 RepID=UPI001A9D687A